MPTFHSLIPFIFAAIGFIAGLATARHKLKLARNLKTAANAEIHACQLIENELELTQIRLDESDEENIKLRKGILQMAAEANLAASLSDAQSRLGQ